MLKVWEVIKCTYTSSDNFGTVFLYVWWSCFGVISYGPQIWRMENCEHFSTVKLAHKN